MSEVNLTRRSVIAGVGSTGLLGIAGCLGTGRQSEDPNGDENGSTDDDTSTLPLTGTPTTIDLSEQGFETTLRTVAARHPIVTSEANGGPVELPEVWAFQADEHDPSVPGPMFTVPEGEEFSIHYHNTHSHSHTVHTHAVDRSWLDDGAPSGGADHIAPDEEHTYTYVASVPGTHFYHCHVQTDTHLDMGMYGILRVEPAGYESADREYFFTIRDWDSRLHAMHAGEEVEYSASQRSSDMYTLNGRSAPSTFHPELGSPVIVEAGDTVRLTLVNAGYESHPFHTHAHRFRVVEKDGSPVPESAQYDQDVVLVSPAERITIEFEADADPGIYPAHCHKAHHVTTEDRYPGGMATAIVYESAMETDAFAAAMEQAGFDLE